MFSKPMFIKQPTKEKNTVANTNTILNNKETNHSVRLSYNDYCNQKIELKKYKIPELKQIAKQHKLHVTGSKPVLIGRIENLFKKCIEIRKLQCLFRGFVTRKSFSLRGPGFKNRKICINDSDFYTLEPLCEIPIEYFVSFSSNNDKFIYGCNIISLIHLLKPNTSVKNPYNRELIGSSTMKNIAVLYTLIKVVFGLPTDAPKINIDRVLQSLDNSNSTLISQHRNANIPVVHINRIPHGFSTSNIIIEERWNTIHNHRRKTIPTRIIELFMAVDLLGNYTNSIWFSTLERRDYIRLYRILYDIWNYRGNLSREVKHKICVICDPFHDRLQLNYYEVEINVIQEYCLKVMEYFVFCGIDEEYKRLGALHMLSALTMVSIPARIAMPWLYESIAL